MKYINQIVFTLAATTFSCSISAAEVLLNTNEIETLLSGNTIYGVHYKGRTTQYFSKSGLTMWIKEGDATPSEGKWKAKNDKYCSDFGGGENCYQVAEDKEQGIHYFLSDGFRAPFIAKSGYKPIS